MRKYQFQRLSQRHRKILRHVADGGRICEVAKRLKTSPSTVSRVVHSELGSEYLQRIADGLARQALKTLDELMDSTQDPIVRLQAAERVLDMSETGALSKPTRKYTREVVSESVDLKNAFRTIRSNRRNGQAR